MKRIVLLLFLTASVATGAGSSGAAKLIGSVTGKSAEPRPIKSGGNIYDLVTGKNLFTIEAEIKPTNEGQMFFSSRYLDADNKEAMTEEAYYNQMKLQKYTLKQTQLNEVYELNVNDKKMTFTIQKNGATKAVTKVAPENLLVGPSFVPFLQKHWKEITSSKKVKANLAVMDYMDTLGFEFEMMDSGDVRGITVRMRPTNVIISAVVNPIYFLVQNDGAKILELKGPMLVKLKVGNSWEDFDGRAVFTY